MSNEDLVDIAEAQKLFAKWEQSQNPMERRRYLEEAVDLLDSVIEGASEWSRRATNIKKTHFKKILEHISPSMAVDIIEGLAHRHPHDWWKAHFSEEDLIELPSWFRALAD